MPHSFSRWIVVVSIVLTACGVAEAQTTLIFDTFSGTDGTSLAVHAPDTNVPNAVWVLQTDQSIVLQGQQLRSTQTDAPYQPLATVDTGVVGGTVAADWTPAAGLPYGPVGGLVFRMSDNNNYWFAGYGLQGTPLALWKFVNGGWNLLSYVSVGTVLGQSHHIEARLNGSAIEIWWDGVQKLTATDAWNSMATKHGVQWGAGADWLSTFDNFSVQAPALPTVSRIEVTPAGALVGVGSEVLFTAQAFDATNNVIPNAPFHWTTSDTTAGIFETAKYFVPTATVRALLHDVTVTATTLSGTSGSASVTVSATRTMVFDAFSDSNGVAVSSHTPDINAAHATWSVHATDMMTVQNGQLRSTQSTAPYQPIVTVDSATADGIVSADWTPAPGLPYGPIGGVIFRVADNNSYWFAGYGLYGVQFGLFRFINGSGDLVAYSYPGNPLGKTHHIEVRLAGTAIQVWCDGVQQMAATDGYASSTRHGLLWGAGADWASAFDNFAVQAPALPSPVSVTISPSATTVYPGGAQTFTAVAKDASNAVIPGTLFHWTLTSASAGQVVTTSYFAPSATVLSVTASTTVTAQPVTGVSGTASLAVDSSRTVILDTFSGSDATPLVSHQPDIDLVGTAWSVHATEMMTLQGQQVRSTQQVAPYYPTALIDTGSSDGIVAADWFPAPGLPYGPIGGIVFRAIDGYNFWFAGYGWQGAPLALWKVANGATTLVNYMDPGNPLGGRHHIEARAAGDQIQLWWDGVQALQVTDNYNRAATRHGLMWGAGADWASAFDNFTVQMPSYPAVSQVVVTPTAASVSIGGFQTFTAQAFDTANQPIPNALFHWTIDNPLAGTLQTPGYFSASAAVRNVTGALSVTASMAFGPAASASVTVDTSHTLVFDSFAAADGTALTSHAPDINPGNGVWTQHADQVMRIQQQQLTSSQNDAPYQPIAMIDSGATDGIIAADWTPAAGLPYGPIGGVIFRVTDPNTYWFAGYGLYGAPLGLFKFVNGSGQLVSWVNPGNPLGATHHIEVRVSGFNIEVWWDGVRQLQAFDGYGATSTKHGLFWGAGADWLSAFDNFSVVGSPRCVAPLSPESVTVDYTGASGSATLSAPGDCPWIAQTDAPSMITLATPTAGTGGGVLNYTVGANPLFGYRVGRIVAGGRAVTITQMPAPPPPCQFSLWPGDVSAAGDGGSGGFDVTTPDNCSFTASTGASWIHVTTTEGQGNTTVLFSVSPNPNASTRSGTIAVGGFPSTVLFTITQDIAGTTGGVAGGGGGGGGGGTGGGVGSTLTAGQVLGSLTSPDGRFHFIYDSSGNIVLSQGSTVLWSSGTSGAGFAVMQGDGNFVRYSSSGAAPWHTNTVGHPGAALTVQNDGNAVIYDRDGSPLWSTRTGSNGSSGGSGGGGGTGPGGPALDAISCPVTISPTAFHFPSSGGSVTLAINTAPACRWRVTGLAPWLTASGLSGVGPTNLTLTAGATGERRLGRVIVSAQAIAIGVQTVASSPRRIHPTSGGWCWPINLNDYDELEVCPTDDWNGEPSASGDDCTLEGYDSAGVPIVACSTDVTAPAPSPDPAPPAFNWCDIPGACDTPTPDPCADAACTAPTDPDPTPAPEDHCVRAPSDFTLAANKMTAQNQLALVYATLPPAERPAAVGLWFASMEFFGQPWDYKNSYHSTAYRDLGNYNFGYIGSLLGYSRETLYCLAGVIQVVGGHYNPIAFGLPCVGSATQGDDPRDHEYVRRGIDDFILGESSICKP